MKIDFKTYNPFKLHECPFYDQIKIVTRNITYRYYTPDGKFEYLSHVCKHYNIPKNDAKHLYKNLDKIQLKNSEYFPILKIGVIPKYVGFTYEQKHTST